MSKILVVDDEREIVDILEKFLTKRGYNVIKAYGGEEGLEKILSGENFDLIILDMKMPRLSGAEVLEKIHEENKHPKVIILSGSLGIDKNIDTIKRLGYNEKDILIKPIDLEELIKAIKEKLSG